MNNTKVLLSPKAFRDISPGQFKCAAYGLATCVKLLETVKKQNGHDANAINIDTGELLWCDPTVMVAEVKSERSVAYRSLSSGDKFSDGKEHWMKGDEQHNGKYTSMRLSDGRLDEFSDNDMVLPVDTLLIETM